MPTVLPDDLARFVRLMAPEDGDVLAELEALNEERGFPMVGPEVGGLLRAVALMTGAERVFEFGSGLGYSAYWFASALPPEGEVVLTDVDPDELETAREFLERAGLADRARFEAGDARETFAAYEGPFDVVLIDHEKEDYVAALEDVLPKLADGGVVVADNAMAGGAIDLDQLVAVLDGDDPGEMAGITAGIADYLVRVRDDPALETVALPLGEGLALSVKR